MKAEGKPSGTFSIVHPSAFCLYLGGVTSTLHAFARDSPEAL